MNFIPQEYRITREIIPREFREDNIKKAAKSLLKCCKEESQTGIQTIDSMLRQQGYVDPGAEPTLADVERYLRKAMGLK